MNHTLNNGNKELQRRREQAAVQKATQTRPPSQPVAAPLAEMVANMNGIPSYPEPTEYTVLGRTDEPPTKVVLDHLGVISLDDLQTGHMHPKTASEYKVGLTAVRQWRQRLGSIAPNNPQGRMFVVCSKQTGGGKTHIASAVLASFCKVVPETGSGEYRTWTQNGQLHANFSLDRRGGRFLTAKELMDQMALIDGDKVTIHSVVRPSDKIIVIDDVGREGKRKWTSQKDEDQEKTTAQLYYDFFNHCYQRTVNGNPVSIFLTSNLLWDEMRTFFNDATLSRINELAPRGHVWEMKGVPEYRIIKSGRV